MTAGDGHTTPERLSALEAKVDRVLEEVSILRGTFVELEKYIGNHAKDLERVKTEMGLIKTIGAWIFAPLLGLVGLGSVMAIVYALMR